MFERYAKGNQRLEDISHFLAKSGIVTRSGKRISKTRIASVLSNPFYVGLFKYGGEIHERKHEPIIAKKLFDEVQEVLKQRGQPERKAKNEPQPFCGLIRCAPCGMMIAGEHKFKRQKNGNVHEYIYYHCTKKRKDIKCPESAVREKEMDRQLSSLIKKVTLPKDWAEELTRLADEEFKNSAKSLSADVKERESEMQKIAVRLGRLLDGYLEQDIEKEVYHKEKAKLLSKKKSLQGEISSLSHRQNDWLEPFQKWVQTVQTMDKIAVCDDLFAKKVIAKEIFGSNLSLRDKKLRACAPKSEEKKEQNPWSALRAAKEKARQRRTSSVLVGDKGLEPLTYPV